MTARTPMIEAADLHMLIGKAVKDEDGNTGVVLAIHPHFCGGAFPIVVEFDGGWRMRYTADGYFYNNFDDHYIKLL
jgi:hypothetical protein